MRPKTTLENLRRVSIREWDCTTTGGANDSLLRFYTNGIGAVRGEREIRRGDLSG
jgi:hypothetical protein